MTQEEAQRSRCVSFWRRIVRCCLCRHRPEEDDLDVDAIMKISPIPSWISSPKFSELLRRRSSYTTIPVPRLARPSVQSRLDLIRASSPELLKEARSVGKKIIFDWRKEKEVNRKSGASSKSAVTPGVPSH